MEITPKCRYCSEALRLDSSGLFEDTCCPRCGRDVEQLASLPTMDAIDEILVEFGIWPLAMIDDTQPGFVDRRAEVLAALKAKRSQANAGESKVGMGYFPVPACIQPASIVATGGTAATGTAEAETQAPVASPGGFRIEDGKDGKARILRGDEVFSVGTPEAMAAELPQLEAAVFSPLVVTGEAIRAALVKFPRLAVKYREELYESADEVVELLEAMRPEERAAVAEKAVADRINRIADALVAKTPGMTREAAIEGFRTMTDQSYPQSIASVEHVSPSLGNIFADIAAEFGIYDWDEVNDFAPGFVDRRREKQIASDQAVIQANGTQENASGQMELGF